MTQATGYCTAYPDEGEESPGIPRPIWWMHVDHRQPYSGDHGIQWEPRTPGQLHPMDDPIYAYEVRGTGRGGYDPREKFSQPAEDIIITPAPEESADGR